MAQGCLSAGAVVQLVLVTSVCPALLLMWAAVSADAHSLNQMPTCGSADIRRFHWNPSPLSAFVRIQLDPPSLPPSVRTSFMDDP